MQYHLLGKLPGNAEGMLIRELIKAEAEVATAYQTERLKWQELEDLKERIKRLKAALTALGETE